jgi:phosphoglycerate dehydrogenase-like enzyme
MEKKFKVVIPELEWEESHSMLEEIAEVKVGEANKVYDESLLIDEIRDVDAIIITSQHSITRTVMEKGEKLMVVVKRARGTEKTGDRSYTLMRKLTPKSFAN